MPRPVIELDHVSKEYRLGQVASLKQTVMRGLGRLVGRPAPVRPPFRALDDVSFTVDEGEVLGIIGHNGAGKSTLLKLLANITRPSHGAVRVRGRVAPLIEVGAGFVGDLTGRENVYLNGTILGMPRKVIDRKFDEIVAFAEMEAFIDTPVKRYSSGMQVKLAFSVATSLESDILIIDEVLAVGDLAFQRKCFERVEHQIKHEGRTVLIVSHNIRQVERLCKRVLLLDHGRVLADGAGPEICNRFYAINDEKVQAQSNEAKRVDSTGDVEVIDIRLTNDQGEDVSTVTEGASPRFVLSLRVHRPLPRPVLVFGLHTIDFFYVWTTVSPPGTFPDTLPPGDHEVQIAIERFPFNNGTFSVRVSIDIGDVLKNIFYAESLLHFSAYSPTLNRARSEAEGIIALRTQWQTGSTRKTRPGNLRAAAHPALPT
ncbi:MAG TPA: ABC transporter ATP-binding protein [Thauera sp.]|uniref:ABC transporter ATP-binding protein n=1 Tax=Thauera sp. TaxID=1905334 RepID=UPI002CB2E52D|nr:ABC transporter ATP-binding protein [Thauera sp.]HRP26603.1 ABC transporter ATP-binding protein [Thauera sp.]HRP67317.1 ABC transporter ATP-binding protein [Thauera sp.]